MTASIRERVHRLSIICSVVGFAAVPVAIVIIVLLVSHDLNT
jgi:hypothetical protein